jgi:hypothetical protein
LLLHAHAAVLRLSLERWASTRGWASAERECSPQCSNRHCHHLCCPFHSDALLVAPSCFFCCCRCRWQDEGGEDALLAKLKEERKRQQSEIDRLQQLRKSKVSELAGLGTKALIDQINAFRKIDKFNIKMKGTSTKLRQLELLADLIERKFGKDHRDRDQSWLEAQAGRSARPRTTGQRRRGQRGDRTWPLDPDDPIQGARIDDEGRREYLVRWEGEDPDAPGEHWETYEYFSSLCVDGAMRTSSPALAALLIRLCLAAPALGCTGLAPVRCAVPENQLPPYCRSIGRQGYSRDG